MIKTLLKEKDKYKASYEKVLPEIKRNNLISKAIANPVNYQRFIGHLNDIKLNKNCKSLGKMEIASSISIEGLEDKEHRAELSQSKIS